MNRLRKLISHASLYSVGLAVLAFLLAGTTAQAQQTTGERCSPSATTTIDGKYLPSPPTPFGGVIISAQHT